MEVTLSFLTSQINLLKFGEKRKGSVIFNSGMGVEVFLLCMGGEIRSGKFYGG